MTVVALRNNKEKLALAITHGNIGMLPSGDRIEAQADSKRELSSSPQAVTWEENAECELIPVFA
jgi:hypothetical protein